MIFNNYFVSSYNMYIIDLSTGKKIKVEIIKVEKGDLPLKKNGWRFNWKADFNKPDSTIYAVRQLNNNGNNIEAIMSVEFMNGGAENYHHYIMNLLEVAPHNAGSNGQYERSAGILISYVCELSYTIEGNYKGVVLFSVKEGNSKLINHYITEYGAIIGKLPIMAFEPPNSKLLMDKFLN